MVKRLIIAVVLLGLVVGGIVGFNWFRAKMISDYFTNMQPPALPVAVDEAKAITWQGGVSAIGTSIALQGTDLAVQAAGIVDRIAFEPNAQVEQNQLLLQIDPRIEQADLVAARAELEFAEAELARIRTLSERGISSTTNLETQQASATSARSQVARLEAVLDQKRLTAPFAGQIGIAQVEAGEYVTPGTVYATLQNLDAMQVDFTVPEQDLPQMQVGRTLTVVSEVGDLTAKGSITAVEPRVNPSTRLISVRAEVENTNRALLPGQFLRVTVDLPPEDGVLTVPQTAVLSNLYGDSVYRITEETPEGGGDPVLKAEQVFVQTGRRSGGIIEITDGLAEGERVITAGQNRLTPGAVVKIDNSVTPEVTAD